MAYSQEQNINLALVYCARCLINNKLYIGKTNRSLEERIKEHEREASTNAPDLFHKTMRDMGLRNFEWKELERCPKEDIFAHEKKWMKSLRAESIEMLNTTHVRKINKPSGAMIKPNVQNAISGKEAWKHPGAKKWMQLSGRLKPIINLGTSEKYESLEDANRKSGLDKKSAIKKSCETGRPTINGIRYAYLDIDSNPILNEGHKKELPRTQQVKNLNTGIIYNGIAEAAKFCGASKNMIQATCVGKYKTARKISFCYIDNNNELLTETHRRYMTEIEQKKNRAFAAWPAGDINREKMKVFDTEEELVKYLGVNRSHISAICRGDRQHDHGWRIANYDKKTGKPELTEAHLAKINKQLRKVICLDDNKIFENLTAAAKEYCLHSDQIRQCCEGILKTTGRGKIRRKFAYLDEKKRPILTEKHKEPLEWLGDTQLFCPQTNKKYQSVAHCSRETGIPQKRIRKYLKNNSVDLGGCSLISIPGRKK